MAENSLGNPAYVMYLDFQNAFNQVPPQGIGQEIKAHGNVDNILTWIEKWLSDRQ